MYVHFTNFFFFTSEFFLLVLASIWYSAFYLFLSLSLLLSFPLLLRWLVSLPLLLCSFLSLTLYSLQASSPYFSNMFSRLSFPFFPLRFSFNFSSPFPTYSCFIYFVSTYKFLASTYKFFISFSSSFVLTLFFFAFKLPFFRS